MLAQRASRRWMSRQGKRHPLRLTLDHRTEKDTLPRTRFDNGSLRCGWLRQRPGLAPGGPAHNRQNNCLREKS
jgi:hypothetical protein